MCAERGDKTGRVVRGPGETGCPSQVTAGKSLKGFGGPCWPEGLRPALLSGPTCLWTGEGLSHCLWGQLLGQLLQLVSAWELGTDAQESGVAWNGRGGGRAEEA